MPKPKFSKGGTVTDEERAEIIRLHGEGKGRNEIARLTRRSLRTVSLICADEGLTFDVTMTEEATRHRMANLAERRAILAEALQTDAEKLTEQLWQPHWVFNFGGKDNTYEKRLLDEPPSDAKKNLMASAGIAIEKSLKLVPPRDDDGTEQVGSLLTSLYDKLRDRHGDG
ncbi:helix-turn-helix domain-containing protein [Streptomyces rochei]|uniref:helix-turn-helix domain-containing protein n=1 Tax=Streptomyces TaxID=1883 RepID=UPI0002FA4987|nr:helix-turn-helix domain-containing protein [Streptomyces sp. TOR3209]